MDKLRFLIYQNRSRDNLIPSRNVLRDGERFVKSLGMELEVLVIGDETSREQFDPDDAIRFVSNHDYRVNYSSGYTYAISSSLLPQSLEFITEFRIRSSFDLMVSVERFLRALHEEIPFNQVLSENVVYPSSPSSLSFVLVGASPTDSTPGQIPSKQICKATSRYLSSYNIKMFIYVVDPSPRAQTVTNEFIQAFSSPDFETSLPLEGKVIIINYYTYSPVNLLSIGNGEVILNTYSGCSALPPDLITLSRFVFNDHWYSNSSLFNLSGNYDKKLLLDMLKTFLEGDRTRYPNEGNLFLLGSFLQLQRGRPIDWEKEKEYLLHSNKEIIQNVVSSTPELQRRSPLEIMELLG